MTRLSLLPAKVWARARERDENGILFLVRFFFLDCYPLMSLGSTPTSPWSECLELEGWRGGRWFIFGIIERGFISISSSIFFVFGGCVVCLCVKCSSQESSLAKAANPKERKDPKTLFLPSFCTTNRSSISYRTLSDFLVVRLVSLWAK